MTQKDIEVSDEKEEEVVQTFDDINLSPLGAQLAKAYEQRIGRLASVAHVSTLQRRCTVNSLRSWGKRGGLCELTDAASPDRSLLCDLFFARDTREDSSHFLRNRSLLLIMSLAQQLSTKYGLLDEQAFGSAVYFGEVVFEDGKRLKVRWPPPLIDIALRWRMFYFHHYMSVALEGAFAWLVTQASEGGLAGTSVKTLSESLNSSANRRALAELLGRELPEPFGTLSPMAFFQQYVVRLKNLDDKSSKALDDAIRSMTSVSEDTLEGLIRERSFTQSQMGLAVPMLLLSLTLARYTQWEGTAYGNWLASASTDPYVDIVPPVMTSGLSRRFGTWWTCHWVELAKFVLSRYVVQQHQSMAYEKTARGDRCLLQADGERITTRPNEVYEQIGMGNGRFRSAVRILKDLGLLSDNADGVTSPTKDGGKLLHDQLAISERA